MREFVKQVAVSLREDPTWDAGKHWVENEKLGCKVWIANGFWFLHLRWYAKRASYGSWADETDLRLSLPEKFHIWRACKTLRKLSRRRSEAAVLEAVIQRRLAGETE